MSDELTVRRSPIALPECSRVHPMHPEVVCTLPAGHRAIELSGAQWSHFDESAGRVWLERFVGSPVTQAVVKRDDLAFEGLNELPVGHRPSRWEARHQPGVSSGDFSHTIFCSCGTAVVVDGPSPIEARALCEETFRSHATAAELHEKASSSVAEAFDVPESLLGRVEPPVALDDHGGTPIPWSSPEFEPTGGKLTDVDARPRHPEDVLGRQRCGKCGKVSDEIRFGWADTWLAQHFADDHPTSPEPVADLPTINGEPLYDWAAEPTGVERCSFTMNSMYGERRCTLRADHANVHVVAPADEFSVAPTERNDDDRHP